MLILTSLLLVLAGPADAAGVRDARLVEGAKAAQSYWGALPEACKVAIEWQPITSVVNPNGTLRVADVDPSAGCKPRIATDWLATVTALDVCRVVVHEFGHLFGLEHEDAGSSLDPVGVMRSGDVQMGTPQQCNDTASLPPVRQVRFDGRTRSPRRASDRKWCKRHARKCESKYPRLFHRSGHSLA